MTLASRIERLPIAARRAAAIGVAVAALAFLFVCLVKPLQWAVESQQRWRSETQRQLARDRGQALHEKAVRQSLEALPSAKIWRQFYAGTSRAEVSRFIEQHLARISAAASVEFESATPLPTVEDDALPSVGVRLKAVGVSAEQLRALLAALRAHEPYLRVERLTVSAPLMQSAERNPPLEVTLDVAGYMQPAKAST